MKVTSIKKGVRFSSSVQLNVAYTLPRRPFSNKFRLVPLWLDVLKVCAPNDIFLYRISAFYETKSYKYRHFYASFCILATAFTIVMSTKSFAIATISVAIATTSSSGCRSR